MREIEQVTDNEIDYYEIRFESEQALEEARKLVPIHAELGSGCGLIKADQMGVEDIMAALEPMREAGRTFVVEASDITSLDMWPIWPEDEIGDDDEGMKP